MLSDFRRTLVIALAGGIGHAILALWLRAVVRGRSVPELIPDSPSGLVFFSLTVAGLVLVGGVALALFVRNRLVVPLTGLSMLFVWAFYSSWRHFETARATGVTPIDIYTDSLFGLLWVVPLALVCLLGALEYGVRNRSDGVPFRTVFE
ncbi:hypothetical protein OB955_18295 [Halobacteria archaeon AArc-m2/3/4]|uniref:Uncharacterized protein n=1 Tax=Natronoglomus mannanivorans TaxID=2979990 RepID=A0AAP3E5B8_9EURY|nr:hypothetical protein [Halobacteria archaeon AArc-xg1-1]MCU4974673.1 hypothetical protein [Halobacteria archaeon AArc-m2/3/4]